LTANQHWYLLQGEAVTIILQTTMHLEKVFIVGNGSDVVYVAGVSS
jgi:hypothetical protein